jgi:protein-L-isoaspartate(D-aspartate) O-methyltransferase
MKDMNVAGIGMTSQRARDRLIERLKDKGIASKKVLSVMRRTPRHLFVDEALASRAYEDSALPIGHGQTISQPYIVARMTEIVISGNNVEKVLEIGTGCGYQAAILAQLVKKVYSVERITELAESTRARLLKLKLHNVISKQLDGYQGWPQHAPYDAIIVTAAPEKVPEILIEQLRPGGRLLLPVGPENGVQRLCLITRKARSFEQEILEMVSFVPLVRGDMR